MKGQKKWTTQCYVKGEKQNERDGLVQRIKDLKMRELLMAEYKPIPGSKTGELSAKFDIIMGFTPED